MFVIIQNKCNDIAFSQLPLFDKVFAVKDTSLNLRHETLKQIPLCCSSYTFLQSFGSNLS